MVASAVSKKGYTRLIPTNLSSTNLLMIYILHCFKKSNSPMYGKEVLDFINNTTTAWKPSHGTLYPLLSELEGKGYITNIGTDNKRKFYILTSLGSTIYEQMLDTYKDTLYSSKSFFDTLVNTLYEKEVII